MYLEHASYSYPTHLVPLLDLALTLLLLALLVWVRRRSGADPPWARALWRVARRASTNLPKLLAGLFLLGVFASAAVERALGPAVPRVVDELSYLFAAETFAEGRLTNATPPHWRHLQVMHVLPVPTSQSKYPPAQALVLTVGVALGHPSVSLWLLAGLLTASTAWLLTLWLPPPWPLVGALAVLLRIAVGSYWNQSFWGGSLAMVAGILVLGGLRVAMERPSTGRAVLLGVGLLTFANSRPFEGLLFSLPLGLLLGSWLVRPEFLRSGTGRVSALRRWLQVALPLVLTLAAGAVVMGIYHHAVTGDALIFPHTLYSDRFMPGIAHFLWDQPFAVPWWQEGLRRGTLRLAFAAFFFVGFAGAGLAALALPQIRRDRWLAAGSLASVLVVLGHYLTRPWHAHYSAPLGGVVILLAVLGLRRLTVALRARGTSGGLLPPAFLAAQLVLCLVQLPAHRPDVDSSARLREATETWLLEQPGCDLVFLCNDWLRDDWVFNSPSLDDVEVLWARELTGAANESLLETYSVCSVWHADLGRHRVVLRRHHDGEPEFTAP